MAPERFRAGDVDARSDVYALACVLHQCLTGQVPFPGSTFEQIALAHLMDPPPKPSAHDSAGIPGAMDDVITIGLAKEPALRYRSATELAAAARAALTTPADSPRPETAPAKSGPSQTPLDQADTQAADTLLAETQSAVTGVKKAKSTDRPRKSPPPRMSPSSEPPRKGPNLWIYWAIAAPGARYRSSRWNRHLRPQQLQ
jgi:serine/threonine-protein kinase